MIGIYKIINKTNGKYYVGSSTELDTPHGRWYKHKRALIKSNHANNHLQSAWNKYGEESFDFVVVEEATKEKLLETEQKYLDIASTEKENCYNINFLAERGEFSDEIINKRTESYKKYYLSHPNPMYNKKHSFETKEKIRKKAMGRRLSETTKKKLSQYTGIRNGVSDKTIYNIINTNTNETFIGIRSDFLRGHNISSGLFTWALKKNKLCKGWKITPVRISSPVSLCH